jgi:hypothetical protein
MPRPRRAKLDKDPYELPARLPRELGEWLRDYAHAHAVSQNAAIIEAVQCLREREDKAKTS